MYVYFSISFYEYAAKIKFFQISVSQASNAIIKVKMEHKILCIWISNMTFLKCFDYKPEVKFEYIHMSAKNIFIFILFFL